MVEEMTWKQRVKIKDLLTEEETPEAIKRAADGIIQRLPWAPTNRLAKARDMADADPETALLVFNDGLNRVYDWADANRVWLE
jgi:hypothetical protein